MCRRWRTNARGELLMQRKACQAYAARLRDRLKDLGIVLEESNRLKTAVAASRLVDAIVASDIATVTSVLASAEIATSETAMGTCIKKASELDGSLQTAGWQTFELVSRLPSEHQDISARVASELRAALTSDEHVIELSTALKSAHATSMNLARKARRKES